MKTLFNRARDIRNGVLESRMMARFDNLNRELTDEETIKELEYLKETLLCSPEDTREEIKAINYLLKKYS